MIGGLQFHIKAPLLNRPAKGLLIAQPYTLCSLPPKNTPLISFLSFSLFSAEKDLLALFEWTYQRRRDFAQSVKLMEKQRASSFQTLFPETSDDRAFPKASGASRTSTDLMKELDSQSQMQRRAAGHNALLSRTETEDKTRPLKYTEDRKTRRETRGQLFLLASACACLQHYCTSLKKKKHKKKQDKTKKTV